MRAYAAEGHFKAGSMGPKVEACLRFVDAGGEAVIASLTEVGPALAGKAGTHIVPDAGAKRPAPAKTAAKAKAADKAEGPARVAGPRSSLRPPNGQPGWKGEAGRRRFRSMTPCGSGSQRRGVSAHQVQLAA